VRVRQTALLIGLCVAGCGGSRASERTPSGPLPSPPRPQVAAPTPAPPGPAEPDSIPGVDASRTILSRRQALERLERGRDNLPTWPEELAGKETKERATIGVCVGTDGTVEEVVTVDGTGDVTFDLALTQAVRAWRYRPLYVDALATPFCHLFDYARAHR
jgi:TonB family protein